MKKLTTTIKGKRLVTEVDAPDEVSINEMEVEVNDETKRVILKERMPSGKLKITSRKPKKKIHKDAVLVKVHTSYTGDAENTMATEGVIKIGKYNPDLIYIIKRPIHIIHNTDIWVYIRINDSVVKRVRVTDIGYSDQLSTHNNITPICLKFNPETKEVSFHKVDEGYYYIINIPMLILVSSNSDGSTGLRKNPRVRMCSKENAHLVNIAINLNYRPANTLLNTDIMTNICQSRGIGPDKIDEYLENYFFAPNDTLKISYYTDPITCSNNIETKNIRSNNASYYC